jgi:hypothetical protein
MAQGHFAGPHGSRALLFISNPHAAGYLDPTGFGPGYDVLTAPEPDGYSVPYNRKSVSDGDVALVYRVDGGAKLRDPGQIVAVACVTSSPWFDRNGYAQVNWKLQLLPPELWISSVDMKASGHWQGRVPFTTNKQATSPVELDASQWNWIERQLPKPALKWLSDHAK